MVLPESHEIVLSAVVDGIILLRSARITYTGALSIVTGIFTMKLSEKIGGRASIMGELIVFLWERKLWWMIPMVTVLVLFGTLMILAQGTALSPFIYTLF